MTNAYDPELRALNPGAQIHGPDVPPERLLGGLFGLDGRGTSKSEDVRAWLGAEEPDHHHGPHHHDVNRHDAAIRAFHLISDAPVPRPAFEMFLDLLRSAHGPKLLRLKGLVALADDPERPRAPQRGGAGPAQRSAVGPRRRRRPRPRRDAARLREPLPRPRRQLSLVLRRVGVVGQMVEGFITPRRAPASSATRGKRPGSVTSPAV